MSGAVGAGTQAVGLWCRLSVAHAYALWRDIAGASGLVSTLSAVVLYCCWQVYAEVVATAAAACERALEAVQQEMLGAAAAAAGADLGRGK